MSRILVTGGTGFVGRTVTELLLARGHDVHVTSRGRTPGRAPDHPVDLLVPGSAAALCEQVRPTQLVHLAWETTPGRFWTDVDANLRWVEASLALVRAFLDSGGTSVVALGTAAEPRAGERPGSIYAATKDGLHTMLDVAVPAAGGSFAWARLHQPYGPGEDPSRLLPLLVRRLAAGERFEARTSGAQERDFIHIQDVAAAVVAVVEAQRPGVFDIGTGRASTVREVVLGVASRLDRVDLVSFADAPLPAHEPARLVADPTALTALGWCPRVPLEEGLDQVVASWSGA